MKSLFLIHNEADFKNACLETFNHQYQTVKVYQDFVNYLKIRPQDVLEIQQIPFLPIELFKNHTLFTHLHGRFSNASIKEKREWLFLVQPSRFIITITET